MFGRTRQERGDYTERKVEAAFGEGSTFPKWLRSLRKANTEEDAKGIDFVADSDVGKLFLQVKTSQAGKEKHLRYHSRSAIGVVIVKVSDTENTAFDKCIAQLRILRDIFLRRRNGGEEN